MAWATVPVDRAFREPRDWESGDELYRGGQGGGGGNDWKSWVSRHPWCLYVRGLGHSSNCLCALLSHVILSPEQTLW